MTQLLTGTGGEAGSNRLERRVSRTTAGATTVTASCGTSSQSVTIAIVQECSENANVQPAYVDAGPANLEGNFGRTVFPNSASLAIDIDANGCFDSAASLWRIRVNSVTYKYLQSVDCQDKTPVLTPGDSVVTPFTYCNILRDFTPVPDQFGNPVAPYETYVSCCPGCVQAHEDQHVVEWKDAFDTAWNEPGYGEAKIEALTAGFVCDTRDTAEKATNSLQPWISGVLQDTLDRARLFQWVGDHPPIGDSEAYWVEAGCLAGIRQLILLRAQNESWPPCP